MVRWVRVFSAVVALVATTVGARAEAGAIPTWNVGEARAGQRTIYNRTRGGALLGFPLAAGDMDGDGRADLILTPMNASSGPNRDRSGSGEAVILLTRDAIAGERDLAELDVNALPADVLIVYGADRNDYFGTQVTVADLDGDGYADAIIGAQYGDGADNARSNSGEVVIVWGRASLGGRVIDLADPPPGAVTFVYGAAAGDRLGAWVSNADVDGDGIADAILGADEANPGGDRPEAGTTYVLYGGNALRILATIDLAAPAVPITAINCVDCGTPALTSSSANSRQFRPRGPNQAMSPRAGPLSVRDLVSTASMAVGRAMKITIAASARLGQRYGPTTRSESSAPKRTKERSIEISAVT